MKIHIVTARCVVFSTAAPLTAGQAQAAVQAILQRRGLPAWDGMEIDFWRGEKESMVIATAAEITDVTIAAWALSYLLDKYGF